MNEVNNIVRSELPRQLARSTKDIMMSDARGLGFSQLQERFSGRSDYFAITKYSGQRVFLIIGESNLYCIDVEGSSIDLTQVLSPRRLNNLSKSRRIGGGLTVLDCGLTTNRPQLGQFYFRDIIFFRNDDVRDYQYINRLVLMNAYLKENKIPFAPPITSQRFTSGLRPSVESGGAITVQPYISRYDDGYFYCAW